MARNKSHARQRKPEDTTKKSDDSAGKRKKPQWSQRTRAKWAVRRAQKSTKGLLKSAPFGRIVRDLVAQMSSTGDARITKRAFSTLRDASHGILVELMTATEINRQLEDGPLSIQPRHMQAARAHIGVHCLTNAQLPIHVPLGRFGRKLVTSSGPSGTFVPKQAEAQTNSD